LLAGGAVPEFSSGNISSGGTFSHTFTTAGSYPYTCTIHPSMVGTITVNP
jgi:plastocyanin